MLTNTALRYLAVLVLAGGLSLPGAGLAADQALPDVDPGLYAAEPAPLTPAECGQCHRVQYQALKADGGRHRFSCQACHQVFHAYNPRKDNYAAIMPQCSQCHSLPHGRDITDCLSCHSNPHAPRKVPAVDRLGKVCGACHTGPARTLEKFPSKHSEVGCQSCHHERHGYIPDCFECHEGHYPAQTVDACGSCHQQVHRPTQIRLSVDADVQTCADCHETVYAKWQATPSKHGKVTCGMCHQEHGQIPDCRECHAEPHDKRQLEMFPECLTCHLDVHDLPVKRKK